MTTNATITGTPQARLAPARIERRNCPLALAIFALALAARLLFLFNSPDRDWPHSIFYEGDAVHWVEWAQALDEGGVFQFNLPIHPPAIAYAIAWLHDGVRTTGFLGMKVLWCAMSAAACAFTFLACASIMPRRIAIIASLLLTFSFGQYVFATSVNNETPYVMLLPVIVLLTQRVIANQNRWMIALLGASHGFAMLLRAEHPLLMGAFALWMLCAPSPRSLESPIPTTDAPPRLRFRARLTSLAGAYIVALLICLPWTTHAILSTKRFNAIQLVPIAFNLAPVEWTDSAQAALNGMPAFARVDNFAAVNFFAQTRRAPEMQGEPLNGSDVHKLLDGEFGWIPRPLTSSVLISNQGPLSFALANHPDADGGFSRAALAHPMRGSDPTFAFAFPPHNRVFTDGWRVGWEFINSDRAAAAHNIRRKFERFADGVTSGFGAANLPLNRQGVREPVDMFVSDAPTARWWRPLTLILITIGVILALARRTPTTPWLLIIAYKLIVTLIFYGYARQGASIAPAFCILMAIAIDSMLLTIDRRFEEWKRWQIVFVIALCALMMISDIVFSRHNERVGIDGKTLPTPELGPGAFQAFNRVEIRATS